MYKVTFIFFVICYLVCLVFRIERAYEAEMADQESREGNSLSQDVGVGKFLEKR